ncbi:hypothetical protein GCM10028775_18410 [Catellatospora paridis]
MYNVALRYAAQPDVKFFVMRSSLGKVTFEAFPFEEIRRVAANAAPVVGSERAKARSLLRRIAGRVPLVRTVGRRVRRQILTEASVRAVEGPFAAGDTVIVLGGNWNNADYLPAIQVLRNRTGFRFYHVVHDLVPVFCPGYVPPEVVGRFTDYLAQTCQVADGLIAVSESTKRDCLRFIKEHGLKTVPVGVMRLGDESAQAVDRKPVSPNADLMPGNYILCVSTVEIRKNHTLLYYVARLARERKVELPPIVLAGKMGWQTGDIQFILNNDQTAKEQFVIAQAVTDAELEWLYRNCSFTIYPSFYEGWGLPIAESLVYGKPCLASNTSSMPEVGGDLVDYFSPYDAGECLDQIVKYLDKATLEHKAETIKRSYRPRSWDDAFQDVRAFVSQS